MSDTAREYVKTLKAPWHVKSFLLLVADYHSVREGCAWPGLATLGEIMGIDPRNVKRLVRIAEATGKFRYVAGGGKGNFGKFYFLELVKEVTDDRFSDSKAVTKEVISGLAIRKNQEPRTNTPLPPFSKGVITTRDRRQFRDHYRALLGRHKDEFGHQRYDYTGPEPVPVGALTSEEALRQACAHLMIPLDQARELIRAAGIEDELARKPPESVAG